MSTFSLTMPARTSSRARGNFVQRHPLVTLFTLIFLLEWVILVPDALASQGLLPFKIPVFLAFAVGWAPALAAIIVTSATSGWHGVKALFQQFLIVRVGVRWYITAVFGLAAIILAGIAVSVWLGLTTPVIPATRGSLPAVMFAFAATMVLGFVINTEEIAWRGVALPHLQATHSALAASLILAVPEGLTHLPYFFNRNIAFYQTVGIVVFMLFSAALTIIYSWMFNSTRGSLFLVTLLHASQAAWANLLSDNQAAPFYVSVGLLVLVAVSLVVIYGARDLSRKPKVEFAIAAE